MLNERITESIVRRHFEQYSNQLVIEEQRSANRRIHNLLSRASKRGTGNRGMPEFIIQIEQEPNLLIVVECKPSVLSHESDSRDAPENFAVDGVLHYAAHLSPQFDILAIAVSGGINQLTVSHYFHFKGNAEAETDLAFGGELLPIGDYIQGYRTNEVKYRQDYDALLTFAKELNQRLHTNKVSESNRSLLISAILIALDNRAFRESYQYEDADRLPRRLVDTVITEMSHAGISTDRLEVLEQKFSFITTEMVLTTKEGELIDIITQVDQEVNSFIQTHKYRDVLSGLYVEFLQYANSDKGLGIVLTPPHITEFFAELARVNHHSTVYDNCAGTGGFLIASMKRMIESANGNQSIEQTIKQSQLFGVELQSSIYPLAVSNMYINQDGRTNVYLGDCFDKQIIEEMKNRKPTVGLLNPPYKADKRADTEELEFVLNNLNCLQQNGTCIAIVPMQCALSTRGKIRNLKERILSSHTLEAVLSMPDELFFNSNVGVVTCAMIFTAHHPHPVGKETYFGYYKNDGFVKLRAKGRIDARNQWNTIKESWVRCFLNRTTKPGLSINVRVDAQDEWAAESYMETDYSDITDAMFEETLLNYSTYLFANKIKGEVSQESFLDDQIELTPLSWKAFALTDLFNISGSRTTALGDLEEAGGGEFPYVTTQATNNGVAGFYSLYTEEVSGGCLTIDSAVLGYCSYQSKAFSASDHVEVLRPKFELNNHTAMFLVTIINMEQYRYNYGRKCSQSRLKKSKIMLPQQENGSPDFELMEKYIKTLPYSANL